MERGEAIESTLKRKGSVSPNFLTTLAPKMSSGADAIKSLRRSSFVTEDILEGTAGCTPIQNSAYLSDAPLAFLN